MNFLPHQTHLQSSQAAQCLISEEVATIMMGRNTKILRKLGGMLRKYRATLSSTGPFGFRGLLASAMQI